MDLYKIHTGDKKNQPWVSSAEWLSKMYSSDDANLFHTLLRMLMISLVTPENLSDALNQREPRATESEDMSKLEKIKPYDCVRRVLTKTYTSMKDLQLDNGKDDIFCDADFDDTPYEILKLYKEDAKKYSRDEFVEFLIEALIQKHDCPPKMAPEMAENMIAGKKMVGK